jgi:MoaA/NifB/PqqE/SkfB family radical SAM enzyme
LSCCLDIPDVTAWMAGFRQRVSSSRIPFTAHLELTSRCNLRCQHCYLGDQTGQHEKRLQERTADQVKADISEWVDAGCLHLILTGGDPMMRPDFTDIYQHACEQGLVVSVFCDGLLVRDDILDVFRTYPPRSVEVTVYGATPETYESVTRVPGSYDLAWQGIHRLLDQGIRVFLKTVLLSLNQHELFQMKQQAESLGCPFRYDAAVFPCLQDGSDAPLALRVSPQQVVELEMQDPMLMEGLRSSVQHFEKEPDAAYVYECGAGNTAFYADPYGALSPCLLTPHYKYTRNGRSFQEVWDEDLTTIRLKKTQKPDCVLTSGGGLRGACTHCPATNFLETGDEELDSPYMKELTQLRYAAIMQKEK